MDVKRYRQEIGFLAFIAVLLILWYSGRYLKIDTASIQRSLQGSPLLISGLIFIALYVVISFFIFFSKDIFWVASAVIFGPLYSALFVWCAEAINACLLFYLARKLGRGYVAKSLAPKYRTLDQKLGGVSFSWLFIFRAAPLIPYRFLDLAAGLTRLRFKDYLMAVILGSPLKIFWIQYILFGVGEAALKTPYILTDYFLNNKALLFFSLIYVVLVIAVFFKLKGFRRR